MKQTMINCSSLIKTVLMSALLTALLAAWGTAINDDLENDGLMADSFVGAVDEDLFIGVMVAPHPPEQVQKDIVVYLCDGAEVSTWLFGKTTSDSVVLENGDTRIELSLGTESLSGNITHAGTTQAFTANLATDGAGLYRAEETLETQDYVGGWIILNSFEQRGAITVDGLVVENPTLNATTGQAETSLGIFSTVRCFINPFTGERICFRVQQ
jgi:hypothetical protein